MNLLLSNYIDKNSVQEWKRKYSGAGHEVIMYKFKGTNGRYLTSFETKFKEFKTVEGLDRSEWPTYENGQQIHKQYTVPMIQTKLFYKENNKYFKTAKGKLYEKYIDLDLNQDEKWFINFILLLDSTIENKENYIINRSVEINDILSNNTSEIFVEKAVSELFIERNNITDPKELSNYDYLYLNSFYLEPEFLKLYYEASQKDREELKHFVYENWSRRNNNDCVTQKYVSTNYSLPELIDDLKIFRFSMQISKIKYSDFEDAINEIILIYCSEYDADKTKLYNFIKENKKIIEPILINVYKIEDAEDAYEDIEDNTDNTSEIPADFTDLCDRPEPRIDDTTIEGKQQLRSIFSMRKKIAREKSHYKCELEQLYGCKYFTSKSTKQNYIEVHHFVPREFRNNFENSIDVLSNYITLCPHCHKMIHLATDRERIVIIRYIYNQRKDRLNKCGINVELEELLDYYNVENEN